MLGRVPGSGGANIGAGPSMSTWSPMNALRGQGKTLAAALAPLLLLAAAPAPKVVAEVKADFNGYNVELKEDLTLRYALDPAQADTLRIITERETVSGPGFFQAQARSHVAFFSVIRSEY